MSHSYGWPATATAWRALENAGYRRCWAGELLSDDPSDETPMYLYRRDRDAT